MPDASAPPIHARVIRTARTATCIREIPGRNDGEPVLLIHGNLSSSVYYSPLMQHLPRRFRPIAVDLRGFGGSDPEPVDATRGMRDFSDDILAVLDFLDVERAHVVGWSMGGAVAMRMAIEAPQRVISMTLIAPVSPFGFGGTIDVAGRLLAPDGAGSGAGTVSRKFVAALADGDRSAGNPAGARAQLRHFFLSAGSGGLGGSSGSGGLGGSVPEALGGSSGSGESTRGGSGEAAPDAIDEEEFVTGMLSTAIGPDNYPGDRVDSEHWPGVAPGTRGVMNALAPTHLDVSGVVSIDPKPPVLWLRGENDIVISDSSAMDMVQRGRSGAIDGYPGEAVAPPQPMLAQTRAVLESYAAAGGLVRDAVIPGVGHAPHVQDVTRVLECMVPHLDRALRP